MPSADSLVLTAECLVIKERAFQITATTVIAVSAAGEVYRILFAIASEVFSGSPCLRGEDWFSDYGDSARSRRLRAITGSRG